MPEEQNELREENEEPTPAEYAEEVADQRRRQYFTRRNALLSAALLAIFIVLGIILSVVFYRYGVFDNYVKTQFVAKMSDIGIVFDADVFRVTVNPLELELKNATFSDRVTGEKLFFIRDADLGLTVDNLYAWQLSRDIKVNTTDINGAEVWIRFDENGRSNFSNLKFVEDQTGQRVNFKYGSVRFASKTALYTSATFRERSRLMQTMSSYSSSRKATTSQMSRNVTRSISHRRTRHSFTTSIRSRMSIFARAGSRIAPVLRSRN